MATRAWIGSPNYRSRGGNIRHIDLHWMVGTLAGTDAIFQRRNGTATHYGIQDDVIHQYVDEGMRAPGTGNSYANTHGISIEHAGGWMLSNGTRAQPSGATHETSAWLLAEIAQRHGLGKLIVGVNVFPHNHWVATMCPGSLRIHDIVNRANEIMGLGHAVPSQGPGIGESSAFPARALYGAAWVTSAQEKLIRLGYDLGPTGADSFDGKLTQAATRTLQKVGGLDEDGIFGPDTNAYADSVLTGAPIDTPLPGLAVLKPPAFPLPKGWYFGPKSGPTKSVSGYYSHREDLRRWQQRMIDRGWDLGPSGADGLYGDYSARVARLFQQEKNLVVDELIGLQTWNAAWTEPVT